MLLLRLLILVALIATPLEGLVYLAVLPIGVGIIVGSLFLWSAAGFGGLVGVAYFIKSAKHRHVTVNGTMYCTDNDGQLQPLHAHVYLYERDWGYFWDNHDYKDQGLTKDEGQFELKGEEKKYTATPEFFLQADILCKHPHKTVAPMVERCQGLKDRCRDNSRNDNGFKWARFYHRFEMDPSDGRGRPWYNLACTFGFKEPNGGKVWNGLSCTGGLKDGRCSEEECGRDP
ncbi:hypothetical protein PMAYCL1PPCAC_01424 [Pristionchus mayeri]|uniref:Uncharacterized protein n=1 Tax=Pristionchus mayeri TaxID=1317129 RepID=A0AAN4Z0M7_9BILA|nr:hypothetical protein PMAYCL1PPCAC_01424 [Pristionchus mayeri]